MGEIIGRATELAQIDTALDVLQEPGSLLRTPIFEVTGPAGSGKTEILGYMAAACVRRGITCNRDAGQQLRYDTSALSKHMVRAPLGLTLELDGLDEEALRTMDNGLAQLFLEDRGNNLFVMRASSRHRISQSRSVDRKTTEMPLRTLNEQDATTLLKQYAHALTAETRIALIGIVGGYPLGLRTAADIILSKTLDLTRPTDKAQLAHHLGEKVIDAVILANADFSEERRRLHSLLALFAIPRRFNLTLAQDLIEEFLLEFKANSVIGYMTMQHRIEAVAPAALSWYPEKQGFAVHEMLRPLLNAGYRFGDPAVYKEIHHFLATWNMEALKVIESPKDIKRYEEEIAYHTAAASAA